MNSDAYIRTSSIKTSRQQIIFIILTLKFKELFYFSFLKIKKLYLSDQEVFFNSTCCCSLLDELGNSDTVCITSYFFSQHKWTQAAASSHFLFFFIIWLSLRV